ncbi:MAG: amidohydrolase [Solirubrobacterales bacterium]|nr:amidohydrolase [Solirubrobacterales bacterium]
MTTATLEGTTREQLWDGRVIDCDVHANVPSIEALFPYMDPLWVEWTTERGWTGPAAVSMAYPPASARACRELWRPPDRPPASSLELLQEHILEPWRTERAVVSCYYGIDYLRHPDWAAALARAVNDWLVAEWLERDPRLVGSLVVPARDPAAMAAEIRRVGRHPQIVQVLLPVRNERLWGQRVWHPVLAAIAELDLVLGLHYGGTGEEAPSATGWASWYVEEYAAEWQSYAAQVTSLVAEGAFQRFPGLRVAVLEGGFTWVPAWCWRMNKEWKGLRREVPWLDRPPLDIVRDHFRFSVAPADIGPPEHLRRAIEWLESDDALMFATDYPHEYQDDLGVLIEALPEAARPKLMSESARAWYRL